MKPATKDVDYKYNLGIYLEILKKYKWLFIGLVFVILFVEATLVVDKFLFKILIDDGTSFVAGALSRAEFVHILIIIAVVFLVAVILRAIGNWVKIHMINHLDADLILELKRKFFNHIVHLSHKFHTSHKTGSLISRLIRGGGAVERFTDGIVFNIVPLIFQIIIVAASLIYFDILPGLVVFVVVFTFILFSMSIHGIQQNYIVEANVAEDREKANVSDVFTNIDSIKYFGKESAIKNRFLRFLNITKKTTMRYWGYYRWLDAGHSLIVGFGLFFLMLFPVLSFLDGNITLGTLTFIFTIYGNVMGPLFGFTYGIRGLYRSMAEFESLFEYGKVENEIKDITGAEELEIKDGTIEFKNVTFSYPRRESLLENFNLKIKKNEKVALVGPSGCGKTTVVKLLYRLYDIDEGEILIDGRNIRDFKQESLRSEMSIVPQECILFDDTLISNIAFSKPDASKDEIMKAIKFARLDEFVKYLPDKENTVVGERGIKLSGGEKQRVSIARAILAKKKVLVLDEATSSLDSKTESEIQKDLIKLLRGKTAIMIAHRLSTIMKADKIVVMDKGKVVQVGTHKQLIRRKGPYKGLWKLQKGGYIE